MGDSRFGNPVIEVNYEFSRKNVKMGLTSPWSAVYFQVETFGRPELVTDATQG